MKRGELKRLREENDRLRRRINYLRGTLDKIEITLQAHIKWINDIQYMLEKENVDDIKWRVKFGD